MRIVNNLTAMNATRMSGINQLGTEKSIEKLSSGQRINKAADGRGGFG